QNQIGNFTLPATFNVNSNLTLTAGSVIAGTDINVGGNFTQDGGTFTPGTGTVTFNGSGAQVINGAVTSQTFNNIIIAKPAGTLLNIAGGTITLIANNFTETTGNFIVPATMTVNGNLTTSAGVFTNNGALSVRGNIA